MLNCTMCLCSQCIHQSDCIFCLCRIYKEKLTHLLCYTPLAECNHFERKKHNIINYNNEVKSFGEENYKN